MTEENRNFDWRDGVSLKEHLECRLESLEKAIEVASSEMNRRLEGMNEFRDALRDQASRFTTRDEIRLTIGPILDDIRTLRESKASIEGAVSRQEVTTATLIALAGLLIGLAGVLVAFIK